MTLCHKNNHHLHKWTFTGYGGPIGRAQASRAEGQRFESRPSQTNNLLNWYLSLPTLAFGMAMIGQGLVSSTSLPLWRINLILSVHTSPSGPCVPYQTGVFEYLLSSCLSSPWLIYGPTPSSHTQYLAILECLVNFNININVYFH